MKHMEAKMSTRKNPHQLDAIAQAAEALVQVIKPATEQNGLASEWPELATAVVQLATALGVDVPLPSASATQPIACRPITDSSGRHIGYWRLCQQCRGNLPYIAGRANLEARGAVFCSPACLDEWATEHPAHHTEQ